MQQIWPSNHETHMQIKNTEYWDFIPTAVSSTLYDQVKSDLILPNPKCTQDSAKWWNSKYEILKYEILNTNKFNSSRKYANFCDWKRKALMFAISSYSSCTSCRLLKRVSDQQKELILKGISFEGTHWKCCSVSYSVSNRAIPGAKGGKKSQYGNFGNRISIYV